MFTTHVNQIKVQSQLPLIYGGIMKKNHEWRVEGNQGNKGNINHSSQERRHSRK